MGTIIPFVPLAKAFVKYLPKIADRPYSKVEAAFCLMVDYDDQNEVTISGYAKLWQWNKKTVSKFIIDHGAFIIYPKDTGNYKNQKGLIGILKRDKSLPLKGTKKGLIRFIDNSDLDSNRDLKGTKKGLITTLKKDKSLVTTIEPKPKPEPKKKTTIPKPENVTDQTWSDFLTHRKNKKAPVTQTVLNAFAKQAELAGMSLEDAFIESVSRGWAGFKAEWVKNKKFTVKEPAQTLMEKYGNQNNDIEVTDYEIS